MQKALPLRPDLVQRVHTVQELSDIRKRHTGLLTQLRGLVFGVRDEERGRETCKKKNKGLKEKSTHDNIPFK